MSIGVKVLEEIGQVLQWYWQVLVGVGVKVLVEAGQDTWLRLLVCPECPLYNFSEYWRQVLVKIGERLRWYCNSIGWYWWVLASGYLWKLARYYGGIGGYWRELVLILTPLASHFP